MRRITIAIASPSDVPDEREAAQKVFIKWNDDNPELPAIHPKMWEFAVPELGGHPQTILNKKIIEVSELLVAVFHSKLGTPTPTASSGTVEEIREFIAQKGPQRVLLYFCQRPVPVGINPGELTRLNDFKASMQSQGLYSQFTTTDEFQRELYRHIDVKVNQLLRDELPLPKKQFSAEANGEKQPALTRPVDKRLHTLIDFGSNLPSIAEGFNSRMETFMAIDGCTNDKYYGLGAHVYTSAAQCLDRFITYSASGIAQQDIRILENISTHLKSLAANLPVPGSDFRLYWAEGDRCAKQLVAHVAHIERRKK